MAAGPRLTPQTIAVLRVLLVTPTTPRYGLEIAREAGLKTGTLHPILARLQHAGWIESFWETPADHEDQGRPRRRYYRFTGDGAQTARRAIAEVSVSGAGPSELRPQPGY
ncbi:MAG: helix-turn-helix transcriptional regulator [Pseudonocardiales bacterium]|nr:helix-turn-helix transcriptional regulator [Pseudonocardiales bacterium]